MGTEERSARNYSSDTVARLDRGAGVQAGRFAVEMWTDEDEQQLGALIKACRSGAVTATVDAIAAQWGMPTQNVIDWLQTAAWYSPGVQGASQGVSVTENDPAVWNDWLQDVCLSDSYQMPAVQQGHTVPYPAPGHPAAGPGAHAPQYVQYPGHTGAPNSLPQQPAPTGQPPTYPANAWTWVEERPQDDYEVTQPAHHAHTAQQAYPAVSDPAGPAPSKPHPTTKGKQDNRQAQPSAPTRKKQKHQPVHQPVTGFRIGRDETFIACMKRLRNYRGLSQWDVGFQSSVGNWETGSVPPKWRVARRWVEALTGGEHPTEEERNLREQLFDLHSSQNPR
ncbi:hypothetical protein [Streptomyces sp. NBC_01614]|uniref:hypothetical protein n=1 Tax=Streptomyces sp. NBC_01614 TaxID=2975897 RepID=UPI00386DCB06